MRLRVSIDMSFAAQFVMLEPLVAAAASWAVQSGDISGSAKSGQMDPMERFRAQPRRRRKGGSRSR